MAIDRDGTAIPEAFRLVGVSQVVAVDSTAKQITAVNADTRALVLMATGGDTNLHVDSTVDSNDFLLLASTYKTFEINAALEYNFTGENKSNINPPNEKYFGIIAGGKITEKIRFATGITDLIKENKDYLANWRGVIRYTLNPTTHFEAVGDIGLRNRNIEKGKVIGFYIRKDF